MLFKTLLIYALPWLQRDHLGQVTSWECLEQLFRQQVESAGDIRLSPRLLQKCAGDQERFCSDVQPGAFKTPDCCTP